MPKISEFHCIMLISNVRSVLEHGVLCHDLASRLPHESVAMDEMQDIRNNKQIPGGLQLHQYANLYFHARNPMLCKRQARISELCVLRIDTKVGHEPGVVFTDGNATSDYVRFLPYAQVRQLPFDLIFAMDWTDPDHTVYYRKKFHKCAEILVPNRVDPRFIVGAYVCDEGTKERLAGTGFSADIQIDKTLFFQ